MSIDTHSAHGAQSALSTQGYEASRGGTDDAASGHRLNRGIFVDSDACSAAEHRERRGILVGSDAGAVTGHRQRRGSTLGSKAGMEAAPAGHKQRRGSVSESVAGSRGRRLSYTESKFGSSDGEDADDKVLLGLSDKRKQVGFDVSVVVT